MNTLRQYILLILERDTNAYPFADDKGSDWANDREQLSAQRMSDLIGTDELPQHLRDADNPEIDDFGPVPPDAEDPYVTTDPFNTDWSVLPTRPMKGIRR